MEYREIDLSFKQRITVGREQKFDSLEVYVGGKVTPGANESPEQALIELAITLKNHLEKEFQLAAKHPSAGQELIESRTTTMAPVPVAPVAQVYTQKSTLGNCGGCGVAITNAKTMEIAAKTGQPPRCWNCFKKTPQGQNWSAAHPR